MDIQLSDLSPAEQPCDLLARFVSEDYQADLADLDAAFDGQLLPWLEARKFSGKPGSKLVVPSFGKIEAREILLLGVGKGDEAAILDAAGAAGREARGLGVARLALDLGRASSSSPALTELALAGNYVYDAYKQEDDRTGPLEQLLVLGSKEPAIVEASVLSAWQNKVRDWVNAPAAEIYPETLAAAAKQLEGLDHVSVEVWDFERCKAEGMVGIVAVGQASDRPGCLIRIAYRPPDAKAHVALVGKGVTFDAGGLSIKPSSGMQTMRCDMGGGATVLGATGAAAELGVPVAIDTFIAAVENMVSGNSYKLGDILEYRNGVAVEVHNTDAEGRLVLADALIEACKVPGVTHVVDLATLTGACVIALGAELTAVFTDSDDVFEGLNAAAQRCGEGMWRMPLQQSYKRLLKADWARIKNVGGREAGSITAALFLQHFVTDNVKWAHLDIAGSAFYDKAVGPYVTGGTGQVTRTLVRWLQSL